MSLINEYYDDIVIPIRGRSKRNIIVKETLEEETLEEETLEEETLEEEILEEEILEEICK